MSQLASGRFARGNQLMQSVALFLAQGNLVLMIMSFHKSLLEDLSSPVVLQGYHFLLLCCKSCVTDQYHIIGIFATEPQGVHGTLHQFQQHSLRSVSAASTSHGEKCYDPKYAKNNKRMTEVNPWSAHAHLSFPVRSIMARSNNHLSPVGPPKVNRPLIPSAKMNNSSSPS